MAAITPRRLTTWEDARQLYLEIGGAFDPLGVPLNVPALSSLPDVRINRVAGGTDLYLSVEYGPVFRWTETGVRVFRTVGATAFKLAQPWLPVELRFVDGRAYYAATGDECLPNDLLMVGGGVLRKGWALVVRLRDHSGPRLDIHTWFNAVLQSTARWK